MKSLTHIYPDRVLELPCPLNLPGPALRKQGLVDGSGPPPAPGDAEPLAELWAVGVPKEFCLPRVQSSHVCWKNCLMLLTL